MMQSFLKEGLVLLALKEAVVCFHLKRPSLNPSILDSCCSVFNLSFVKKVVDKMVGNQLQRGLEEVDNLDPLQSKTEFSTEGTLVELLDDF